MQNNDPVVRNSAKQNTQRRGELPFFNRDTKDALNQIENEKGQLKRRGKKTVEYLQLIKGQSHHRGAPYFSP